MKFDQAGTFSLPDHSSFSLGSSAKWAVKLPRQAAKALASLRMIAGLQVLVAEESLWLRGAGGNEELRQMLRCLPATQWFFITDAGALIPWGRLTPIEQLPRGEWIPLRGWGEIKLPPAGWPAKVTTQIPLTWERSDREQPCGALLASWGCWLAFVEQAPQARLDGLAFALNERQEVLIRGALLPPLPGMRLVDYEGIFVPAGWSWAPAVEPQVVRECFALAEGDSAIWLHADVWECVPADAWVKATRSAVRATARERANAT